MTIEEQHFPDGSSLTLTIAGRIRITEDPSALELWDPGMTPTDPAPKPVISTPDGAGRS